MDNKMTDCFGIEQEYNNYQERCETTKPLLECNGYPEDTSKYDLEPSENYLEHYYSICKTSIYLCFGLESIGYRGYYNSYIEFFFQCKPDGSYWEFGFNERSFCNYKSKCLGLQCKYSFNQYNTNRCLP